MVIKTKDDVEPAIKTLEGLLAVPSISRNQREQIEEEISNIRAGARGEREAAYHIDFKLKDWKNYVVVHDLRLEHNGRVAQIDHLVVGRLFDIILIESKNIGTALRITSEGEFEVKTRYGWRGMASPVEQSKRHAQVLSEMIMDLGLTPKRLGIQIRPTFHHWVLVPPECNITRQGKDATILKMDMFGKHLDAWIDRNSVSGVLSLAKVVSQETVMEFGGALACHHQPIAMNFAAKFGISIPAERTAAEAAPPKPQPEVKTSAAPKEICCEKCQALLEEKVVNFCKLNRKRFDGKLLCRTCQSSKAAAVPSCDQCGTTVEEKVVSFCRFNSRRFGKRILCRPCQERVISVSS